jgi:hypothetical protein
LFEKQCSLNGEDKKANKMEEIHGEQLRKKPRGMEAPDKWGRKACEKIK